MFIQLALFINVVQTYFINTFFYRIAKWAKKYYISDVRLMFNISSLFELLLFILFTVYCK